MKLFPFVVTAETFKGFTLGFGVFLIFSQKKYGILITIFNSWIFLGLDYSED